MLQIQALPYNPFQCNCYLVWDTDNLEALIFDPSFSDKREHSHFDNFISNHQLKIKGVYNTHLHFDHCLGIPYLQEKYQLGYAADKAGLLFLDTISQQAASFGLQIPTIPKPTKTIKEGDSIAVGAYNFEVLSTPGHADGSLCFVCQSEKVVITGDALFRQSIGRTDLPTGDLDLLLNNLKNKLFTLPKDYKVYPGHGPSTDIGYEIAHNPFIRPGEILQG